ncbi:ninjurin-2 [Amyelois transitella]|uniref:ninjurin-2 n=1 Tax=Amyelois transitella TaxID=680683 RepID=UPI00298F7865|nr:ninjurin-2 [Amyelois transitella]
MADDKGDSGSENGAPTVNIDEIVIGQAATDVISDDVKGLDANRYATKKTVAQGMLDIALLTSNASQLKYVLQVGPKHEFYTLLVVLISISIILQVVSAIVAIVLGCIFNINRQPDQGKAEILNNVNLGFKSVTIGLNVLISIFYSIQADDIVV